MCLISDLNEWPWDLGFNVICEDWFELATWVPICSSPHTMWALTSDRLATVPYCCLRCATYLPTAKRYLLMRIACCDAHPIIMHSRLVQAFEPSLHWLLSLPKIAITYSSACVIPVSLWWTIWIDSIISGLRGFVSYCCLMPIVAYTVYSSAPCNYRKQRTAPDSSLNILRLAYRCRWFCHLHDLCCGGANPSLLFAP